MSRPHVWASKIVTLVQGGNTQAALAQIKVAPSVTDVEQLRTLLANAVRREIGTGRPACFLSGGTDSSTVAGMIREVTGQAPASYSIGFEAEGYDEMAYARIAAKHFGTDHHEYYVTPDDLIAAIPQVATHYDQPFGNSSALPAYYCAKFARENGVTRLLAGDGGLSPRNAQHLAFVVEVQAVAGFDLQRGHAIA